MKIGLMVGNLSEPGGGERCVVNLANYLSQKDNEVIIYHFGEGSRYSIYKNVKICAIPNNKNRWLIRKLQRLIGFISLIKKESLDFFYAFGWAPSIYGVIACGDNIPVIASERIDPLSEPELKILRVIRNFAYKKADILICQTNKAAEYFHKYNTKVILNPLKPNLPERYLGERKKKVVNFCRFTKQKNLELLITSFSMFLMDHGDYELFLYGKGPLKDELVLLCKKMEISEYVHFNDFNENVHELIKDARMYVSSSNYEGLSNSMLEAMGIGLPVICTNCPIGGPEMVIEDHFNGILIPMNDAHSMCDAMKEIADDEKLTEKLSKNAYKIRDKLSEDNIYQQWYSLIDEYK